MKSRCGRGEGTVHPSFIGFREFLREMGPMPAPKHTVDRIDNDNPLYGPGLCRWADAKTQANNRSTTRFFDWDGEKVPLTEVARRLGEKPATIRKRLQRGWTEAAILTGIRGKTVAPQQWPGTQDATRISAFEKLYRDRPTSLEGENRTDFYIGRASLLIGQRRHLMAKKMVVLDYLLSGRLPPGQTPTDMEMVWNDEYDRMTVVALRSSIRDDEKYVAEAEALIAGAEALRPGSQWSRRGEEEP